ncbi:YdcF family protein [Rhizobium sp. S-51]|uniref:YdcF family protein n=2 Tax=Rhizobium terricola TaxID=2728849 RepID=A0A7Y0AYM0_9HYPH|nr:YdcF family protein [Rhizobium terricola]
MTMGRMRRDRAFREDLPKNPAGGLLARRGLLRRFLHYAGLIAILLCAVILAGFLWFADSVTTLVPPADARADAIVVLTGGYQRIDQAVELLRRGSGRRLLISGAHPTTSPAQIRKMTQSSPDLFECCVDVGYEALDTIGNANETSRWIHDHGYASVLVVTNNYHMPRSLMELRRIDRATNFIPYPVVNADLKHTAWYADPNVVRTLLSEYGKTLIAYARGVIGWGAGDGLRSTAKFAKTSG